MESSSDCNAQTECLQDALFRLQLMESRCTRLEEAFNTAVSTLTPKIDALLSETNQVEECSPRPSAIGSAEYISLLRMAARGDGKALSRMLADKGIDLRRNPPRSPSGDTALHVAASGGYLRAVSALLGAGAQADALDQRRRTPLHCAVVHGHLAVARRLLDAGAEVDLRDRYGSTPVELAARGKKEIFKLLMQKGVSLDACDIFGNPLLVLAAKAGRWDIVQFLLEKGASPTKCKAVEECALVIASEAGQVDAVHQLLRRGAAADADQVEEALDKAKSAAVVRAFVAAVPEQVRGEAGRWGLLCAAEDGRLEPLVALLKAGVDANVRNASDETALLSASSRGHAACVRELLARGADANAKVRVCCGNTPLHVASHIGDVECVRELLARGANVAVTTKDGLTALHRASSRGHVECVRALLSAGANPAARDTKGKTPLDLAKTDEVRQELSKNTVVKKKR